MIKSDEVNYLIWRYLNESGFHHTAFAFQAESKANIYDRDWGPKVEVGALVSHLQLSVQYLQIQQKLKNPNNDIEPISLVKGKGNEDWHISSSIQPTFSSGAASPLSLAKPDLQVDLVDGRPASKDSLQSLNIPFQKNGNKLVTTGHEFISSLDYLVARLGPESFSSIWCAFNPLDSKQVLSAQSTNNLTVFALSVKDETLDSYIIWQNSTSQDQEVTALEWQEDGELFAMATVDSNLEVFEKNKLLKRFDSFSNGGPIIRIIWTSADDLILVSFAQIVRLNVTSGMSESLFETHRETEAIFCCEVDTPLNTLFFGLGGTLHGISLNNNSVQNLKHKVAEATEIFAISWNNELGIGAATANSGALIFFDREIVISISSSSSYWQTTHDLRPICCEWHKDRICVGCHQSKVVIYTVKVTDGDRREVSVNEVVQRIFSKDQHVLCLSFSPSGDHLVCGLSQSQVAVMDSETLGLKAVFTLANNAAIQLKSNPSSQADVEQAAISTITWSKDGSFISATTDHGCTAVISWPGGK